MADSSTPSSVSPRFRERQHDIDRDAAAHDMQVERAEVGDTARTASREKLVVRMQRRASLDQRANAPVAAAMG
jgi:hypothetical protein